MFKSPLLKYVAGPQKFAFMPPILGQVAIGLGIALWFGGLAAGFGAIPGLIVGLAGCGVAIWLGFKDDHMHNILMARQKWMNSTPGIVPSKGRTYVA